MVYIVYLRYLLLLLLLPLFLFTFSLFLFPLLPLLFPLFPFLLHFSSCLPSVSHLFPRVFNFNLSMCALLLLVDSADTLAALAAAAVDVLSRRRTILGAKFSFLVKEMRIDHRHAADRQTHVLHVVVKKRALWVPDETASSCSCCQKPFDRWLTRRHHCRSCGRIICFACMWLHVAGPRCTWCFVQMQAIKLNLVTCCYFHGALAAGAAEPLLASSGQFLCRLDPLSRKLTLSMRVSPSSASVGIIHTRIEGKPGAFCLKAKPPQTFSGWDELSQHLQQNVLPETSFEPVAYGSSASAICMTCHHSYTDVRIFESILQPKYCTSCGVRRHGTLRIPARSKASVPHRSRAPAAAGKRYCPKCQVFRSSAWCQQCGTELTTTDVIQLPIECSNCFSMVGADKIMCEECGQLVRPSEQHLLSSVDAAMLQVQFLRSQPTGKSKRTQPTFATETSQSSGNLALGSHLEILIMIFVFPVLKLRFLHKATGQYGTVIQAVYNGLPVAIKAMTDHSNGATRRSFRREVGINSGTIFAS